MLAGIILLFLLLIARLVYLQIFDGDDLQQRAANQWTRNAAVSAMRGSILDSTGSVLAQSASTVHITCAPDMLESYTDKDVWVLTNTICDILGIEDRQGLFDKLNDHTKNNVSIQRQVELDTAQQLRDAVAALRTTDDKERKFQGLYYPEDTKRYYPKGSLFAQMLGITNIDGDGQLGLELSLNKYLAGEDGKILTERDRYGRELVENASAYIEPIDGYDVKLTVNYAVESYVHEVASRCMRETGAKSVQAMVMEVDSGAIIASVVLPDYDLNDPPREDVSLLNALSRNKNVTDSYEPGSTFKILTTAAALDAGAAGMDDIFSCNGSIFVDGDRIKCWRSYNPHGTQTLTEAVANSCNPVFVTLAMRMGRETMYDYLVDFGIGQKTGVDLAGEASGSLIAEKYVKNVDLARIGFGQSVAVTPVQLLAAGCAVVNGGNLYRPYVVDEILDSAGNVLSKTEPEIIANPISSQTSAQMREILETVVRDGGGRNAYVPGYRIGGKTGTAQKYVDGVVSSQLHIGSFIGFAPIDDPKYAVLFICDEPQTRPDYGSVVAAPYAGEILEQILSYYNYLPEYTEEDRQFVNKQDLVPDLNGVSRTAAKTILESTSFTCLMEGEGEVVSAQLPAAGTMMRAGSQIILYFDSFEEAIIDPAPETKTIVPDVIGYSLIDANRALEAAGLNLRLEGTTGVVIAQKPEQGTTVLLGDSVLLTMSGSVQEQAALGEGEQPQQGETP